MVEKPRTSPFADKELKSLLYIGAKATVKHNKEYRLYYPEKTAGRKAPLSNHEQCYEQIIANNLQCGKKQNTLFTGLPMSRPRREKRKPLRKSA